MAARAPRQSPAVTRSPAAPTQSGPQEAPSLEQPGAAHASDLDTQLEHANRLGHHFEQLPTTARPSPRTGAPANGLPGSLKNRLERLSGMDLSDVRVHYGSSEPTRLQAFAATRGNTIHLAPGQEHHLPHEGWHVVQQRQGRVRATAQRQGNALNTDTSLEKEADVMGSKASSGAATPAPVETAAPRASSAPAPGAATGSVSQLQPWSNAFKNAFRRKAFWGGLGGLGYGAFVGNNAYRQQDIMANPHKYLGPKNEQKGRLRAVYETGKSKEGSMGQVMHGPVSKFHLFAGDIGSSDIGSHYANDIRNKLDAPDTDENIHDVAEHETEKYWKQRNPWKEPLAYGMGNILGTPGREFFLKKHRDQLKKNKKS